MEKWRPVETYEGLYEVSDYGRVRSLPREIRGKAGARYIRPGRVLKQKTDKDGYRQVGLTVDRKVVSFQVHRLVAAAFVIKLNSADVTVNHADLDKANNRADNLEWMTQLHNIRHAFDKGAFANR